MAVDVNILCACVCCHLLNSTTMFIHCMVSEYTINTVVLSGVIFMFLTNTLSFSNQTTFTQGNFIVSSLHKWRCKEYHARNLFCPSENISINEHRFQQNISPDLQCPDYTYIYSLYESMHIYYAFMYICKSPIHEITYLSKRHCSCTVECCYFSSGILTAQHKTWRTRC